MADKDIEQNKEKSLQHGVTTTLRSSGMNQADPITYDATTALDYNNVDLVDITDDYMFSTVMQDPELCRELLERLLPRCKIKKVSLVPLDDNDGSGRDVGEIAAKGLASTTPLAGQAPHDASFLMMPEIQKTMSLYYGARGIRMDVYMEDDEQIYDIEMQATRNPYLAKRSFLYQSHLGISQTRRGCGYDAIRP